MNNIIWIINFYAVPPHHATMFRHICFAKEMIKSGYDVRIFCSSTIHNSDIEIDLQGRLYREIEYDGLKFVHLKTKSYKNSNFLRMIELWKYPKILRNIYSHFETPCTIIHTAFVPFDLYIAKLAKKMRSKYIVEIADLWPASFVEFGLIKKYNPFIFFAYAAERWLYHKADKLVFTIEGGKDYIVDKGWHHSFIHQINLNKVVCINQGVDLDKFDSDRNMFFPDDDLDDTNSFKIVYIGSIRRANNLNVILDAAELILKSEKNKIKFLVFGDGDKQNELKIFCQERGLSNIIFKGRISPEKVPSVLSRSDLNLFHFSATSLIKYGLSPNKLFIYFASGKPILSTVCPNYDLIKRYNAGLSVDSTALGIVKGINVISKISKEMYLTYCKNSRRAALDYDYQKLAQKMISLFQIY